MSRAGKKRQTKTAVPSRDSIEPEEIKRERNALGLSQRELAALLDIPVASLRHWEQGTQGCANPALLRFAFSCLREHRMDDVSAALKKRKR